MLFTIMHKSMIFMFVQCKYNPTVRNRDNSVDIVPGDDRVSILGWG